MKNGIFLLLFLLLSFPIFTCNDQPFITEGATYKIIWDTENSGKVIFDADEYFTEPYERSFNQFHYVKNKLKLYYDNDKKTTKIEECYINRYCSAKMLDDFADEFKSMIVCEIFLNKDRKFLVDNGFLKEGVDFINDENGITNFIGKTELILEYLEATLSISANGDVTMRHLPRVRITQINNVKLSTDWETGLRVINVADDLSN